jgi:hypothetical protein
MLAQPIPTRFIHQSNLIQDFGSQEVALPVPTAVPTAVREPANQTIAPSKLVVPCLDINGLTTYLTYKIYTCQFCPGAFQSTRHLLNHLKAHQTTTIATPKTILFKEFHFCSICSAVYPSVGDVLMHQSLHHKQKSEESYCPYCHVHCALDLLEIHVNTCHHIGLTCYQCHDESMDFKEFEGHVRSEVHSKYVSKKRISCGYCVEQFKTVAGYRRHIKTKRHKDNVGPVLLAC